MVKRSEIVSGRASTKVKEKKLGIQRSRPAVQQFVIHPFVRFIPLCAVAQLCLSIAKKEETLTQCQLVL